MNLDWLNELFDSLINQVYSNASLVNEEELLLCKDYLLVDVGYLPYLLRVKLGDEYTRLIVQDIDVCERIMEDIEKSITDKSVEFIDWILENKEYANLLDGSEKELVDEKVKKILKEKEYLMNLNLD